MKTKIKGSLYFFLSFLSLLFVIERVTAQNDTIFYDDQWKKSEKQLAAYFRVATQEAEGRYLVKDYFITGELQMEGVSRYPDRDYWEGKVTWYNKDGSLLQIGNFAQGRLNGDFESYIDGKKLMAVYKNGRLLSGKTNSLYRNYRFYSEIRNDTLFEISHLGSLEGPRNERYLVMDDFGTYQTMRSVSYDSKNKVIAEAEYRNGGIYNGSEMSFYDFDKSGKTISHYENGKYLNASYYDKSGILRIAFKSKPKYRNIFYDASGKVLDSVTYYWRNGYLAPFEGRNYVQAPGFYASKQVTFNRIQAYKGGEMEWEKEFRDDRLFSYVQYGLKGKRERILYYDASGKVNDSLVYKNYNPWVGTEYGADLMRKYQEGKVVKEIQYYKDSKNIFKDRTGPLEIFYDEKGKELGRMTLEADNYYTPLDGKQFYKDGQGRLNTIYEYKNGAKTKETFINYAYESQKPYKEETFYDASGYNYVKKVKYFSNGKKQSDIDYQRYKEIKGSFYDFEGNLVSTYDYTTKDGEFFEYFYASDSLSRREKWSDGTLERLLRYEEKYLTGNEKAVILVEDIDVNNMAKIYTRDGVLLSELQYKDKKPFEGTFYDYKTREKVTYSKGVLEGKYQKFRYDQFPEEEGMFANGEKNGKFTFYDSSANVTHFINYVDGKKEGEATYYGKNGEPVSTMIFKDDNPYEGKQIIKKYKSRTEEVYTKGQLVSTMEYLPTGNVFREFNATTNDQVKIYHPDSEELKYDFELKKDALDGVVKRFDTEGKEIHSASFADGKFQSGTLWIRPIYDYDKVQEKIICTKSEEAVEMAVISLEGKTIFKAMELVNDKSYQSYLQKLNLNLDYVNYLDLY
ncbi:MAG: hypothetical protein AAGL34_06350 [Bacteroidota bacterium]